MTEAAGEGVQSVARCSVCATDDIAARVHHEDGSSQAFCAEHAPFALQIDDELAAAEALYRAGRRDPETLFELGAVRLRAGSPDRAASVLGELLRSQPRRVAVLELLASCEEAGGDLERAIGLQRSAVAAEPDQGERHARLARLLAVAGDLDGALAAYEAGHAADAFHFECVRRAAVIRMARSEAELAVALLRTFLGEVEERAGEVIEVVASKPPLTSRDLGGRLAHVEQTAPVVGRRSYEVAAARFSAWRLLGDAYTGLGQLDEAATAYDKAPRELASVPAVLLVEVAGAIGESLELLVAWKQLAEEDRDEGGVT